MNKKAALAALFLSPMASLCHAWGNYGHRVIGAVAERFLLEGTKKEVIRLAGKELTLEDLSTWADEIVHENRKTAKWHFLHLPKDRLEYDPGRDCPKAGCLVSAIEYFETALSDEKRQDGERLEALKFIIHFIGDLHSPLHCGYREDLGGKGEKVWFFGRKTTLLKVWESDILARNELPFEDYVETLARRINFEKQTSLAQGSILDWYFESRSHLKDVYRFDPDRSLAENYHARSLALVDDQLLKAGIRLAHFLDSCLKEKE